MSMTVSAICYAVSAAFDIVQSFRTETLKYPVSSGHGTGFWDFYSYSSISEVTFPTDKISAYITKRMIPRLLSRTQISEAEDASQEMATILEDYVFVEGWHVGGVDIAVTGCTYQNEKGRLYLDCYNLEVHEHFSSVAVTVTTMRAEIEYVLAKDWVVYAVARIGGFKSSAHTEIEYLPPAITPDKIIGAIAIAFAPCCLGLMKLPPKFLETIQSACVSSVEQDLVSYGMTPEQQEAFDSNYQKMLDRQTQYDKVAQDAVKAIGTSSPTLD